MFVNNNDLWVILLPLLLVLTSSRDVTASSRSGAENRYSFSLTTFDPSGKLGQVDRAMEAAALGVPVAVVVVRTRTKSTQEEEDVDDDDKILFAAPQKLLSPFMVDDGTPRFVRITPEIIVGHTGLSADGRALSRAAQSIALRHWYSFDEDIPVEIFLQKMSLLFQEYTVKPGCRPFGCTLVVGYVPRRRQQQHDNDYDYPQAFRIDPSGSIVALEDFTVINGRGEDIDQLKKRFESSENEQSSSSSRILADWFREHLTSQAHKTRAESVPETILTASASSHGTFLLERHSGVSTKS